MNDAVCFINIGPRQRRLRRNLGLVSFAAAVSVVLAAVAMGLPPVIRLVAAPLFYGGFAGILQARAKT